MILLRKQIICVALFSFASRGRDLPMHHTIQAHVDVVSILCGVCLDAPLLLPKPTCYLPRSQTWTISTLPSHGDKVRKEEEGLACTHCSAAGNGILLRSCPTRTHTVVFCGLPFQHPSVFEKVRPHLRILLHHHGHHPGERLLRTLATNFSCCSCLTCTSTSKFYSLSSPRTRACRPLRSWPAGPLPTSTTSHSCTFSAGPRASGTPASCALSV